MGLKISDCEYQVGDWVVVSEEVRTCSFGVNDAMLNNIGCAYIILRIKPDHRDVSPGRHSREFRIYINDGAEGMACWTYDEGCFEPIDKVIHVFESANIEDLFS